MPEKGPAGMEAGTRRRHVSGRDLSGARARCAARWKSRARNDGARACGATRDGRTGGLSGPWVRRRRRRPMHSGSSVRARERQHRAVTATT